jgi:DNA-binding protein YbaB
MVGGDFGDLDFDRIMKNADRQFARIEVVQNALSGLVGRAEDEDGLVSVEYAGAGLRELTLHPKAMRLTSGELAERIKEVIADAAADLRVQISEVMEEEYGEDNPMRFAGDREGALEQVRQAEAAYNRTAEDVMGELDRIMRRMQE